MKRVPKKIDQSTQHAVMKNWSAAMVEMQQQKQTIRIISGKELAQNSNKNTDSKK